MIVLHVVIGLNRGGAELVLKRVIEAHHVRSGVRHVVVSLTDVGAVGQQLQSMGVEVHSLGMRSILTTIGVFFRLQRLIRQLSPDIVQTWMYHADFLGGLAARLVGLRAIIWGVRSTDISKGGSQATLWVRRACALLSCFVPHTIVCAAEASRRLHAKVGYCAQRMKVIPNGYDLDGLVALAADVEEFRRTSHLDNAMVVGCVGRFSRVKGFDYFVQAAGLVTEKLAGVRFLMVGRGLDKENVELMRWIEQTGVPERFILLGERRDIPVCLAAMDVFCLSSRTEGFPNVVGEAMGMGVSCVVADVGDAALLVGDTGVVVAKEDGEALAKGILHMLSLTADARSRLGQAAQRRVAVEFSMRQCADRFEALYHEVLSESGRVR